MMRKKSNPSLTTPDDSYTNMGNSKEENLPSSSSSSSSKKRHYRDDGITCPKITSGPFGIIGLEKDGGGFFSSLKGKEREIEDENGSADELGEVHPDEQGDAGRNLVQHDQAHIRENPYMFMKQIGAWAAGTSWRGYTDYIGGRVFYEGYSEGTIRTLLDSEKIRTQIRFLALSRLSVLYPSSFQNSTPASSLVPTSNSNFNNLDSIINSLNLDPPTTKKLNQLENQLLDVVRNVCEKMVARMDSVQFLRFFGASVNNILVRMYHQGIHISLPEFIEFREVAKQAAAKRQSLLILPCHKSHIDYLTISWLFFRLGLSLPHIVAGENLDLPILGSMLRKCGAFFIRRSFGDDLLYPVVIKEYIEQLIEKGMNIECFIEGGRSRTGKLLPPKLGILKYVVDALLSGRTDDVWLCPISVQYDKIIETESYVNELLGNPKEKESLWGLIANTRVLQLKMGRIDVRFKKPYSLKKFLNEQVERRSKSVNIDGQPIPLDPLGNPKDNLVILKALAYKILSDINSAAVIMPAALVGTVILTLRGRGVGKSELVRRVNGLRTSIIARGGKVADFGGMSVEQVVERALEVMKDLIGEHQDLIEPTYYASKRFELSFYRNQVIHLFVSEAIFSAALYTRVKQGGTAPSQRMHYQIIMDELAFLSQLLKNEFVYGTEGITTNANSIIDSLVHDRVILREGDLIGLSPRERSIGRENFDFYCFLMWPFIETYWIAAVSLFALTPSPLSPSAGSKGVSGGYDSRHSDEVEWVGEKDFQKRAQHFGKTLFYQGDVSYLEAINQATLQNAFERFSDLGILLARRPRSSKAVPMMALHPDWQPRRSRSTGEIRAEGQLWAFLERLGSFRREGKNRRDNSTVSNRVLALADAISPPILERTMLERKMDDTDQDGGVLANAAANL